MWKIILVLFILILTGSSGFSQDIIGIGTRWKDSFREWEVYTADDWRTGELRLRWSLPTGQTGIREDWTEWDFRLGDTTAQIKQKWADDPNLWEIKCLGVTVTARTTWNNDFRQWRLSDSKHRVNWQSRYGNIRDEWIVREDDSGFFSLYTYWEGDPRDWVVIDELDEDVSYAMRVALIFIAIFNSVPKV
ncbi:MAG TPA: hypothetical protein VI603_09300 [Saprospiraceae bacterium]|nr:hypothetical protein [Saprospiraceae bacterium]